MIFCEPLQQRALAFHNCLVPHFPPPVIWCRQFQSCTFHPCIFDGADKSSLAFSVAPPKQDGAGKVRRVCCVGSFPKFHYNDLLPTSWQLPRPNVCKWILSNTTLRDRPKLGFGFGFGTETDGKRIFGLFSVSVECIGKSFGFGRNAGWIVCI